MKRKERKHKVLVEQHLEIFLNIRREKKTTKKKTNTKRNNSWDSRPHPSLTL